MGLFRGWEEVEGQDYVGDVRRWKGRAMSGMVGGGRAGLCRGWEEVEGRGMQIPLINEPVLHNIGVIIPEINYIDCTYNNIHEAKPNTDMCSKHRLKL